MDMVPASFASEASGPPKRGIPPRVRSFHEDDIPHIVEPDPQQGIRDPQLFGLDPTFQWPPPEERMQPRLSRFASGTTPVGSFSEPPDLAPEGSNSVVAMEDWVAAEGWQVWPLRNLRPL